MQPSRHPAPPRAPAPLFHPGRHGQRGARALALRPLCLALLAAAMAAPAAAAGAQPEAADAARAVVAHRIKGDFPRLRLAEHGARGQRALDQLGTRLPELAAWYGRTPEELRNQFRRDHRWRLDRDGRIFIVDEIEGPLPAAPAPGADNALLDGTLLPPDQTFLLHSKPGAQRTIYLNFRGATLSGTAWNSSNPSITALPFDTDGMPYTFSTAELLRIQAIWQRVAEDFAPFDVNVTTEPVPADRLARNGSTDSVYGTTVLVTSSAGVYSCGCGGVAYLGAFDDTSNFYKPALVFHNALSNSEKLVAEAISHEAGHNMGLGHDGTASTGYYTGQGSGATGWAPIMGVGYYQALSQWSRGQYAGASNLQDDYAVMQANGLPLRADDHGNTAATATTLAASASGGRVALAGQGVVERPTDIDFFRFSAGAGAASFSVSPAVRAPNLDAVLTLRNAAGTVLASSNPADALNGSISINLAVAGTYTLSVQGTGKGDPLTTGYSNYGSLGQYRVQGSVPVATAVVPPPPPPQPPQPPVTSTTLRVADIAMGRLPYSGSWQATAAVRVVDAAGQPVAGVVVSGLWSGLGAASKAVLTDAAGVARTFSPTVPATPGSLTFTVTGVSRSGFSYNPAVNTETSDSVSL